MLETNQGSKRRIICKVYSHAHDYKGKTSIHLDLNIPRRCFNPRSERGEWEIKPNRKNNNMVHIVVKSQPDLYCKEKEIHNETQAQEIAEAWKRRIREGHIIFAKYHKLNKEKIQGDIV